MGRKAKFLGVAAVLVFAFGTIVFAQMGEGQGKGQGKMGQMKNMTPEERAAKQKEMIEQRVTQLTEKLGLSADQQAKLREILVNTADQTKAIMEEAFAKTKELREGNRDAIKALLTDEQKAKFEADRPEMPKGEPAPQQ